MILPLVCILVGFVLYIKKFKIDEKMYATILSDLEARAAGEGEKAAPVCENEAICEVNADDVQA